VIATTTGFALLDLSKPASPHLRLATAVGSKPTGIAVSSNGDHVAVAAGSKIYGYSGLLAAMKHRGTFHRQTAFELSSSANQLVDDLAYTTGDVLVALHGSSTTSTGWQLTLVGRVPAGHHQIKGSLTTTRPRKAGSLSVWPNL
jgi:hypothetical protein